MANPETADSVPAADVGTAPMRAFSNIARSNSRQVDAAQARAQATAQWWHPLTEDINLRWAEIPVLACSFVSGITDCVSFNAGSVFVSMQTGNTIFLALGAADLPVGQPRIWLPAIVSLCAFWLGCYFFSSFRHFHPQRKITLFVSFFIQAVLIFISAALAQSGVAPAFAKSSLNPKAPVDEALKQAEEYHYSVQIVIALLAFQSSGQIVLSRALGFNEIPSNVVTSLYCDLISDAYLFSPLTANVKRNRRLVAVVLLLGGGILGSWLQRTSPGMPGALWLAGAVKMVIALGWLGWNGKSLGDEKSSAA